MTVTAGVPFKIQELLAMYPDARLIVDAAFGADLAGDPAAWTWTDITRSVHFGGPITIAPMGRSDETSTAQPAGCGFTLLNPDGHFTPYSTTSQFYPYVRRNTPLRVRVVLTANIADAVVLFLGLVNGWNPTYDETGRATQFVTVTANGKRRQVIQGKAPLKSPLERSWTAEGNLVTAWKLSEGRDSVQGNNFVTGGTPMTLDSGTVQFGQTAMVFGESFPKVTGSTDVTPFSGRIGADVPLYSASTWQIEALINVTATVDNAIGAPLSWTMTGGTYPVMYLRVVYDGVGTAGNCIVAFEDVDGAVIAFIGGTLTFNIADGQTHYVRMLFEQVTATTARFTLYIDDVYSSTSGVVSAVCGTITHVSFPGPELTTTDPALDSTSVGYVAITTSNVDRSGPADGFTGETATDRLQRLMDEEGIFLELVGSSDTTMGPQGKAKLIDLFNECETADGGTLYDGRNHGFTYVARSERYNLDTADLTLDADNDNLLFSPPFTPIDDDQRDINVATATRSGGGSATYERVDGPKGTDAIGVYDTSQTFNVDSDDVLPDRAGWIVHLGQIEGFRYPKMSIRPGNQPALAAGWLACNVSSRVDIDNISVRTPTQPVGDVALLLEGWTQVVMPTAWTAVLNLSSYTPWEVGLLTSRGFMECGGSTLNEDLDLTETGVDVLITDACAWGHASGNYVIVIGDEEMTVTAVGAVSGSIPSRTQTLTVTRGTNGVVTTHDTGDAVTVRDPIIPTYR